MQATHTALSDDEKEEKERGALEEPKKGKRRYWQRGLYIYKKNQKTKTKFECV